LIYRRGFGAVEEQGYIEIKVNNFDRSLTPKDVDIDEIQDVIVSIETFLFPTKEDKRIRPHISYDIESGSAVHKFFLPISLVILFNGLTSEIEKRKTLDFLDFKRQEVMAQLQQKALKDGLIFEFRSSLAQEPTLRIDNETNFETILPQFFESEFYLYGEIYQEGGKKPNIHISTTNHGNLTISATKEQILEGEKRTYQPYGVKVKGKKNLIDGKLFDLELIEFINYRPIFDKSLLDKMIERASENLGKIKDIDSWIDDLRTEGI
jgi:hypothetical protein